MTGRAKALMWTGIGLCAAGAAGLVVGGVLDVDAADPWASVAGGAAGLVGLALTIHALFSDGGGTTSVTAGGARSVAAGGSIGVAVTGDGTAVAAPPAAPSAPAPAPPAPRAGNVTASGDRSIAAGGDIGSASTGDGR
ncbi:hypothetical protein ACFWWT_17745 [Streptomyces sp. NPDC058676]|uniref:hypothetical protein n=1 Tax=unclassified Streptomyces TaxID=2593676 RepID=UPI0036593BD1